MPWEEKQMAIDWDNYQRDRCLELSDEELLTGIIACYNRDVCDAEHWKAYPNSWKQTDECRMFLYSTGWRNGLSDHWNMREFFEWVQENRQNRPGLLERLANLKAFW
jgi:hypothetical protein